MPRLLLNKPQSRFLDSKSRYAIMLGGRGSGKSTALCYFLLQSISENSGGLTLIGAQNPAALHTVLLKSLVKLLDEFSIEYVFGSAPPWFDSTFQSHVNVLSVSNGWQAVCRSLHEAGSDRNLRGLEISDCVLDETRDMSEDAFDIVNATLRDKSGKLRMRMASTPNGKSGWLYRRLIADSSLGCDVIRCTTMDNSKNLPTTYAEDLKHSYSKELYAQEVLGEFINIGVGLAFNFTQKNVSSEIRFNPLLPIYVSLDLNVQPFCGIIAQVHGQVMHVFDEIHIPNNGMTRTALRMAKDMYPEARECFFMVDEAGNARSTRTIETDVSIAMDEARRLWPISRSLNGVNKPRVRDRINALNAMLDPAVGEPRMLIHPRCKETIMDMETLQWDETSTKLDKSDPMRSHHIDALNYLSWRLFPPGGGGKAFGLDSELQEQVQRKPAHAGFPAPIGAA